MNINDIRIAVLIPTRGERDVFLKNCFRMLDAQTLKPNYIHLVDYEPENNDKDITQRYKRGYQLLTRMNSYDVIAFIEDDDFYHPEYLETMVTAWDKSGRPDLFGTDKTIYYHIKIRKYFTFNHPRRSSAMNMLVKPGINLHWCEDNYAFTDMHLWNMTGLAQSFLPVANQIPKKMWLNGVVFSPDKIISIGMKHGVGMCGGRNHIDRLERYNNLDADMKFLKDNCDVESFEFYSTLF
jgi:glycosyltransferase involved in cell wall biosynthesis